MHPSREVGRFDNGESLVAENPEGNPKQSLFFRAKTAKTGDCPVTAPDFERKLTNGYCSSDPASLTRFSAVALTPVLPDPASPLARSQSRIRNRR